MIFKRKTPVTRPPLPVVDEIPPSKLFKFMYSNFIFSNQCDLYLALNRTSEGVDCLKFEFAVHKYGYPNDEVEHPLMAYGLGHYGFFEVKNSPWIKETKAMNALHPKDNAALHTSKRHFVAKFKDVTLEVIAYSFEQVRISENELIRLFQTEMAALKNH